MKTLLTAVYATFCVVLAAFAESITLAPSADTTLFENFPDNNLGRIITLAAGTTEHEFQSRALIKFNVAGQIPPNVIVSSARLRLKVVKIPLGPEPSTFFLHRVLTDWSEGDKSLGTLGELAAAGQTTWNNRFHPSTGWSEAGGVSDADYSGTVSSSAPVFDIGTYLFDTSPQMVADVQHWLANPAQNFGWILISGSEEVLSTARRFGSREDAPNAAALEIEYAPPFRIENVALAAGNIRFSFAVEPLFTYTVESRNSLASGNWNTLTNFTETVTPHQAMISDSANGSSRFYRVLKAPCNCQ